MTYNIFFIWCFGGLVPCEPYEDREVRAQNLPKWFADRDEDIVFFQEMLSNNDVIKEGMIEAGYCGQAVAKNEKTGSGLGIFTKFEILETKFIDWCDSRCGHAPLCFKLEAIADKGALYAKIQHPDGTIIHAINTHTQSDSTGNDHKVRLRQFKRLKEFIEWLNIPEDEFLFIGGDMNEDYNCSKDYNKDCDEVWGPFCSNHAYFYKMLGILNTDTPDWDDAGYGVHTYNSKVNKLLAKKYESEKCKEHYLTLDYLMYSKGNKIPNLDKTKCHVERPTNPTGYDLSDHLPVSCTYDFSPPVSPPVSPLYVTVSYIKCIELEDSGWNQDDEIVVMIDEDRVWPGVDSCKNFEKNMEVHLSSDEKSSLLRNIDEEPVYCLRELDWWDTHHDIGCIQWTKDRLMKELKLSELPASPNSIKPVRLNWKREGKDVQGSYNVIFSFSYEEF